MIKISDTKSSTCDKQCERCRKWFPKVIDKKCSLCIAVEKFKHQMRPK